MNHKPLLPLQQGDKKFRGKEVDDKQFIRLGVISRVDNETGYVDINWLEGKDNEQLVRLPILYSSLRSSIRAMPEEGSIVFCGKIRQTQTWEQAIILGFIDLDIKSLLEYNLIRNNKTSDKLKEILEIREKIGYSIIRGKRRKIYPGEIQIESSPGAELYLDEDIYLSDSKLNEIEIRSADKSIRFSSNQLYVSTQASRSYNGLIAREPYNSDSDYSLQPTVLSNGQKILFFTDSNNPVFLGGRAFTENRIELYEMNDGIMRATEINAGYEVNPLAPYITFVLGTLVGNDKTFDTSKYAKVLRPQIFAKAIDTEVSLDYLECTSEEYTTLASTLHFKHLSRAQIDIDKEGHLFTFFPSSSGRHSLGAGRSWEAGFDGSIKFVVGAENIEKNSISLDTKGGIRASIGYDNIGKSSFIIYQKGKHQEIMAPSNDGSAYFLKTKGDYRSVIDGNYNLEVTGDYNISIRGKVKFESLATMEESFINDKNNVYGGAYNKIVVKGKQEQIGYNNIKKITGTLESSLGVATPALPSQTTDEYELLLGTKVETYKSGNLNQNVISGDIIRKVTTKSTVGIKDEITTGDHEINVTTGDIIRKVVTKSTVGIKDEITTGDHITNITTGDFKVNVTTGNVKINANTIAIGCSSTGIELLKLFDELLFALQKTTVATMAGPQPLSSFLDGSLTDIKTKLNTIKGDL